MIDIKKLLLLKAFEQHQTITETARAMYLTPAAVSQQLASLSKELGAPVLSRKGRRVYLTPCGRVLLAHLPEVFDALERMQSQVAQHLEGSVGIQQVGAFSSALSGLVAPAIADLAATHPGWRFAVTQAEPEVSLKKVLGGSLDLAVTMSYETISQTDSNLDFIHLTSEPYDAVLPAGHRLCAAGDLTLTGEISKQPWITSAGGTAWHDCVIAACARAGVEPQVVHTVDDFSAAAALVLAGAGIALIPRLTCAQLAQDGLVVRPVTPCPTRQIYVVIRRGWQSTPLIDALVTRAASLSSAQSRSSAPTTAVG